MLISSLASAASRPNNSGPEDSLEDKGNGNKQSHFSSSANNACLRPVSGTDENSGLDGAGVEAACVPANVCPRNLVPSAVPAGQMLSDVVWTTAEVLVVSGFWSRTKLEELNGPAGGRPCS